MASAIPRCKSCSSSKLVELNTEVCFHFPGLKGLKIAPVIGFPTVVVCCECGFVQANLSVEELRLLRERAAEFKAVSV